MKIELQEEIKKTRKLKIKFDEVLARNNLEISRVTKAWAGGARDD